MSIERSGIRTCRVCGRPLVDATSRAFRIGPECRKGMTPDQLRASLQVAKREADPFYIPPDQPLSARAQHTNDRARQVVAEAAAPVAGRCRHDGIPGACPLCRQEADPTQCAARIIREIQAERLAARDARYEAWRTAHQAAPEQLELA